MLPKWKDPSNRTPDPNESKNATTAIAQDTLPLNAHILGKREDARLTSRITWTKTKT